MRLLRIWLLLFCLLCAAPANASLDLTSDGAAEQSLDSEVRRISVLWKVNPTVRFLGSGVFESLRSREVRINRNKLLKLTRDLPEEQALVVVRFLLGHEFWHQVQFADSRSQLIPRGKQRQVEECQADVMGASYAASGAVAAIAPDTPLDRQAELRDQLLQLSLVINDLEGVDVGDGDYPTTNQRIAAVKFGISNALVERLVSVSDPSAVEMVSGTRKAIQWRDGDDAKGWSKRVCQRLVHAGSGYGDVKIVDVDCRYNIPQPPPALLANTSSCAMQYNAAQATVDYSFKVSNTGSYPVRVALRVGQYQVPMQLERNPDIPPRPTDYLRALMVDFDDAEFELEVGETKPITGSLFWDSTHSAGVIPEGFRPSLFWPDHEVGMLFAERLPSRRPPNLSNRLEQLDDAIAILSGAAGDNFRSLKGEPCRNGRCVLAAPLDRFTDAKVEWVQGSLIGRSYIRIRLYFGSDRAKAMELVDELISEFRSVRPAQELTERPRSEFTGDERLDREISGQIDEIRMSLSMSVYHPEKPDEDISVNLSFYPSRTSRDD